MWSGCTSEPFVKAYRVALFFDSTTAKLPRRRRRSHRPRRRVLLLSFPLSLRPQGGAPLTDRTNASSRPPAQAASFHDRSGRSRRGHRDRRYGNLSFLMSWSCSLIGLGFAAGGRAHPCHSHSVPRVNKQKSRQPNDSEPEIYNDACHSPRTENPSRSAALARLLSRVTNSKPIGSLSTAISAAASCIASAALNG